MSRGLGALQRRICEVLEGAEGYELTLRELRGRLGEPDRSNLRRAIRGLLERKIVEELRVGGERRVGFTFWAHRSLDSVPQPFRPRAERRTRPPGPKRELKEAMEEARRLSGAEAAEGSVGLRFRRRPARKRAVGGTQGRVLGALWHHSDPLEKGLPVGGDRSNTRRAIRTLLRDGSLEELEGGERLRLSSRSTSYFHYVGPDQLPSAPVDDERAEEILREHEAAEPTRQRSG